LPSMTGRQAAPPSQRPEVLNSPPASDKFRLSFARRPFYTCARRVGP
jgi:hypothetical protein